MATDRTLAPPRRAIERARPPASAVDATSRAQAPASASAILPLTRHREATVIVGLLALTILAEWPLL
jgi:hypothetical protein